MEFLQQPIAGMPLWIWAIIVGGGGLALAWYLRKQNGSKSGALGQNAAGQAPQLDPSLYDPYTGVPLSIESATNPATGLPNYYNPPTPQAAPAPSGTPTPTPTPATGGSQLTNSRYTLPGDMTTNDLAKQFGLKGGWADIAYNSNNAQLDGGKFLQEAYNAKGNNVIKKGTAVWIPASQAQSGVTGTGPTDQATPYWPQMLDVQGVH